jgi:hypothetical protein
MHFGECSNCNMVCIQSKFPLCYHVHNPKKIKIIISMCEIFVQVSIYTCVMICSHHDRTWDSQCLCIWKNHDNLKWLCCSLHPLSTTKPSFACFNFLRLSNLNQGPIYEPNISSQILQLGTQNKFFFKCQPMDLAHKCIINVWWNE